MVAITKNTRCAVLEHPLAGDRLVELRYLHTQPRAFREATKIISVLLALEATKGLRTQKAIVETPLGITEGRSLSQRVVLVEILRAGARMIDPILQFFPEARIGTIGTRRGEKAQPMCYCCVLPSSLEDDLILMCDPMLATGGTICDAITKVKAKGGRHIKLLSILAAPEGVARVESEHKDVVIHTAAVDERLDDRKYIVPGLGDAGDRLYGTTHED